MKLKIRLVSVLFPAALALVIAAPPALASAAPAPHAGSSAVTTRTSGGWVPISMAPGTHTVSETIPVSSSSAGAVGAADAASQANLSNLSRPGAVSPMTSAPLIEVRVGYGNCAGFNGDYRFYIDGWDADPGGDSFPLWDTEVWGIEWNNCGTNTAEYTYVKLTAGFTVNTAIDPTVSNAHSVGVDSNYPSGLIPPTNLYVTACLGGDGWLCGRSAGPFTGYGD